MFDGIEYNNLWSQGRGGSSMSHGYYGEHFYSEWFTMAVAWTGATGQDWVSKCDFAAHTPEYYIFHYRPWTWPPQVVHVGVNAMCAHWQSITPAKFEGDNLAVLAAARFHDGLGQWWVDQVISKVSMGWGTSALGQGGVWGKLPWYDPDLKPVAPGMLPPARLFPENGHVVMRWDWSEGATYALFRCGRYGEIDGAWGRNNADNLHFIIAKRGILAADTGAVHSLNNAALGFAGSQVHSDGLPHIRKYARQTIAHNSLYEPVFRGEKTPDRSLPPEKQLVLTPDGKQTAPHPRPGGRFLHTGGDTFIIDDRGPDMTGRLFCKILLPEEGSRVLRTVGGPWHELEVNGVNYGPTEETYADDKYRRHRKAHRAPHALAVSADERSGKTERLLPEASDIPLSPGTVLSRVYRLVDGG